MHMRERTESGVHPMPRKLMASSRLCRRHRYHIIEHLEAAETRAGPGLGVDGVNTSKMDSKNTHMGVRTVSGVHPMTR